MAVRTTGVRYDLIARDSASRTFSTVSGSAARLERGLGKLGKAALGVGAALGAGLAAGLAVGTKKAVAFEAEMKKIQTQAGATSGDVKLLSAQVLELGKTTQQGPEKLAESLYHLKSVGMDNVQAMKALRVASDLAAVGGSDLEATTNAMAGAWRTGIKGAETFAKTAATVNAVIGAGNMRMEDFTSAIGTGILPSAKSFGLSMQQVGAALALMTDEGIPATDAATRLRMSFSLLGAPSRAADKQLAKIGLTGLDLAEAMRGQDGLIGALTLLKGHLDNSGLSAARQSQILSRSFGGGRSSSGILTLLNNLDVLRKKQEQVNSSIGKYGPAVKAQRKTAAAQLALIRSNLEVLAIKAGNVLLPPLTSFVTYINRAAIPAVHRFGDDLVQNLVPVDRIKTGFTTAQGLVTDFFAGFKPKAAELTLPAPTLKVPGTVIPDTLKAPALTLPTPTLHVPKTAIPSTLAAAVPQKSQAREFGEKLRGLISGGIGDAFAGLDWGKLGKQLGGGLATAIGWVGEHTADLTKRVGSVLAKVDWVDVGKTLGKTAVPLAIGILNSLFSPLFTVDFWTKHWLDTILAVVSVVPIGRVAGVLGKVLTKVPLLRMFSPFLERIGGLGRLVEKPLGKILQGVGKVATGIGRGFIAGLDRVFPGMSTAVVTGFRKLVYGVFSAAVDLLAAGKSAGRGIGTGIVKGAEGLGGLVGRVIGYIVKPFTGASGWLVRRGVEAVTGLVRGIGRGAAGIGTYASARVIAPFRGAFTGAGGWLVGRGSAVVGGLRSGAVSGARGLGGWFKTNVVDKVTGAFTKAGGWLAGSGAAIISGLVAGTWDWLSQKGHDFGSWANKIKNKIVDAIVDVFDINSPSKVMMKYGGHIVAGLQHGMLQGKKVLHSVVKGLFHSPLDAAKNLLSNGVSLSGEWLTKILGAAASTKGNAPLGKSVADAQNYAAEVVAQFWPTEDFATQMGSLRALWEGESGWRWNAKNPTSGAYGIPQALPASKMASAGSDWQTNPRTQILWGLNYIRNRYGSPSAAYGDWLGHSPHWYARGGLAPIGQTAWVGERGPELMQVTGRGTRIYNNADSMAMAKLGGIRVPGYAKGTTKADVAAATASVAKLQHLIDELTADLKEARHKRLTATTKKQRHAADLEIEAAMNRLQAARKELAAAKHKLSAAQAQARREAAEAKAQARRVQGIANTLNNGFLKTLQTGTAASITAAIKGMNSKLQAAGAGRLVAGNLRTAAKLGALADRRTAVRDRIAQARQYSADKAAGLGEFLSVGGTQATSIGGLIKEMQTGQKAGADFSREVSSLGKRGLNKNLLGQLADAGPGSQLATTLAGASDADIARLNQLAKFQSKLTVSFGKNMADTMFDSGKNAGKGFLTGLIAQEKDLQKEMDKLAQGLVDGIKKALGIKSPSTVMRDQVGRQLARGVAVGVRMHTPVAIAEVQRMADTAAAVRARGGYGHAGGGAPPAVAAPAVQHITNHREIHLHGAKQTSAEQAADLMRHMQVLA
jgi:TP901 family phage tail tape measure protein